MVAYDDFRTIKFTELKAAMKAQPVLVDIRQIFTRDEVDKEGFFYQTL